MIKKNRTINTFSYPFMVIGTGSYRKTVRKGVEIYKGRQSRIQDIAIRRYQMAIGLYPTRLGYLWSFQYQQRQTEHGDCSRRTERSDGTRRTYRRFTLRRNRLVQASIRCPRIYRRKKMYIGIRWSHEPCPCLHQRKRSRLLA